jgi:alanyl-tRNA synthetase
MDTNEIRKKYLNFMTGKGHAAIAPAPLVLEGDPTTLFTGSGMQPLMPYLLGEKHPLGQRLVDSQPCFRTQDIEDVGDNRHTTFFEMLGNWSLGDYFKEFQIRTFFEFLTKEAGLNPENIYVTCFIGDEKYGIPRDDEAAEIWQKVFKEAGVSAEIVEIGSAKNGDQRGINPGERIFFYNDKENWWSRAGGIESTPIGDPCGPDSEVFYDYKTPSIDIKGVKSHPAGDDGRFVEIGNQVFMQYRRLPDGTFEPLKNKNVDFGGGLERIAAAAINSSDIYKISALKPIIDKIEKLSSKTYEDDRPAMQVIADHLRGAVFLASQGLAPSNKEQGYVLRRLVRRAILKALNLGIEDNFLAQIVPVVSEIFGDFYPVVKESENQIISILEKEEKAFRATLKRGIRELSKMKSAELSGKELFKLQDTFGFPLELSVEEAARQGIDLSANWQKEFDAELAEQRKRSQTATKGIFKGGLEDHGEQTVKYHTAAHLLDAALRKLIDPKITQKGSNITAERLRYDFSLDRKLDGEELKKLEVQVNEWIDADLPVEKAEYDTDYALDVLGAHGVFRDKYGDKVTVYTVGGEKDPISREVCGGPHVTHTGVLGRFRITKEESSASGVRRIKAILE